jgi:hypothetical protein
VYFSDLEDGYVNLKFVDDETEITVEVHNWDLFDKEIVKYLQLESVCNRLLHELT